MTPRPHPDPPPEDVVLLLEFLRGRDAPCPRCGYNLRDLAVPRCPECREDLWLTVGIRKLGFGWFLAAVTPGLFSGICAGFLVIPMVFVGGTPPWPIYLADGFGWVSGLWALMLIARRHRFILWPQERQRVWAIATWVIHVAMFFILFTLMR